MPALVRPDSFDYALGFQPGNMFFDSLWRYAYYAGNARRTQRAVFSYQGDDFLPTFCGFLPTFCDFLPTFWRFFKRLAICFYIMSQISDHRICHEIPENFRIVILARFHESLDVIFLVFFKNYSRNQPEFKLKQFSLKV